MLTVNIRGKELPLQVIPWPCPSCACFGGGAREKIHQSQTPPQPKGKGTRRTDGAYMELPDPTVLSTPHSSHGVA